jgi:hypothetical protein
MNLIDRICSWIVFRGTANERREVIANEVNAEREVMLRAIFNAPACAAPKASSPRSAKRGARKTRRPRPSAT